jgi:hypothetical protein
MVSYNFSSSEGGGKGYPFNKESHSHGFWNAEEVILLDVMTCSQTVNLDLYIQTLKTL